MPVFNCRSKRAELALGCQIVFAGLLTSLDVLLIPSGVKLFWWGLWLTFPVVRLAFRHGLMCSVLMSLWVGALYPEGVLSGCVYLGSGLYVVGYVLRRYVRMGSLVHWVMLAGILTVLGAGMEQGRWVSLGLGGGSWINWVWNTGWSLLAVIILGPGYFRFQDRVFRKAGVDLDAELQPV